MHTQYSIVVKHTLVGVQPQATHDGQIRHSSVGTMTQCYVVFLLAYWHLILFGMHKNTFKYDTFFALSTSVFTFMTEVSTVPIHFAYLHSYLLRT